MSFKKSSLLWALLAIFVPSQAADFRNWDAHSGNGAFQFLETFQGPRSQALSGAGGSVPTQDALSILVNPATVERATLHHHFALAWETGALGANQGLFAYNTPYRQYLFQTTVVWKAYDAIEGTDVNALNTGTSYLPFNQAIYLSLSFPLQNILFGVSAKLVRDHLSDDAEFGDQDALGWGLDWGLVWRSPYPRFGFGLAVLDLGQQARAYTQDGVNGLGLNTRIRASAHYRPALFRGMTIALDAEVPRYVQPTVHAGLEYVPIDWAVVRLGTQRTMSNISDTQDQLSFASAGFGLKWKAYTLDYSVTLLETGLGQKHRVGLRTGF
jgi:hypothetical protein